MDSQNVSEEQSSQILQEALLPQSVEPTQIPNIEKENQI